MKIYSSLKAPRKPLSLSIVGFLSKGRKIWKLLLVACVVFSVSFLLILYGAQLQKRQTAANIQQILHDALKTKTTVFRNYLNSYFEPAPKLTTNIKFEDIQLLNAVRENALEIGHITDLHQSVSVPAEIWHNDKKYKVNLSPTGLNLDMIGDAKKRAFKVKVKKGDTLFGMSEFKLLPPKARHGLVEFVGHELEKNRGLIALRYFFVNMSVNGDDWGVYAVEEHFGKELLEASDAREGLIFKTDPFGKLRIFNEKKYAGSIDKRRQMSLLRAVFKDIANEGQVVDIERILDLQKFADHLAILELMDGHHALGINSFLYFNPITNLVEPITREYNSLRLSDGPPTANRSVIDSVVRNDSLMLFQRLLKSAKFNDYLTNSLLDLSDPEFLNKFFEDIDLELQRQKRILHKSSPFYYFPKEYLYLKQKQIKSALDTISPSEATIKKMGVNSLSIEFENNSFLPIEILDVYSVESKDTVKINDIILAKSNTVMLIENLKVDNLLDLRFRFHVVGRPNEVQIQNFSPLSQDGEVAFPQLRKFSITAIEADDRFIINNDDKIIDFTSSRITLDSNLYIPEGYMLRGTPGLEVNLVNGASIYSHSPLKFKGSFERPIKIKAPNFLGGGIYVSSKEGISEFFHVDFEQLTYPDSSFSGLTSSITFYETAVDLRYCNFSQNRAEDFVNFFRSDYNVRNVVFSRVASDAIDSDFSDGTIQDSLFNEIGNDALDFSGSDAILTNIKIYNTGDKALSAGEESKVIAKNLTIKDTEIGITSKDLSDVAVENASLENVRLGVAVFQKKEEFGGASIEINNLALQNVEQDYLVDVASTLLIDKIEQSGKLEDVEAFLYGEKFGKSSK